MLKLLKLLIPISCIISQTVLSIIHLEVNESSAMTDVERIGINLGTWTNWGAEQFSKNVIMNPGFEGDIDRVVVIVSQADKSSFSDEADWGYDNDYWKGAHFEVRTGSSKGTIGKVTHSFKKGPNGFPYYVAEKPLPPLEPKDIIVLTKINRGSPIPNWSIPDHSKDKIGADHQERKPLSSGKQSLTMSPLKEAPAELNYYLDAISSKAGKMLPVNGQWRFSIWAKSDSPENSLKVTFKRLNNSPLFFEKEFHLSEEWEEYSVDFDATDSGQPQTLQLQFIALGDNGKVWLDDAFLGHIEPNNQTEFRQPVIDMLLKINPSFIRDTQGQLGDTLKNRLADIYGRQGVNSRAFAGNRSVSTPYSIPDLLTLCKTVNANPWIIIPPTISDEEGLQLGKFLALEANREIFSEVILEFGNENWNWIFRAYGIPYPQQSGLVAESLFEQIQKGAQNKVNMRKFINGQHVSPNTTKEFARATPSAESVGIAPYFFYTLDSNKATDDNLKELFKNEEGYLQQTLDLLNPLKKKAAVYEVNLHTTKGNAESELREQYTASRAAGSALAKRLLEVMLLKIQPIMVFSLAQFETDAENHAKAKLWGVVRDLGETQRIRPQGLAIIMLNSIIGGNMHTLTEKESSDTITAIAFKEKNKWSLAAVNASQVPQEVEVEFHKGELPQSLWILSSKDPLDSNENDEEVKIDKHGLNYQGSSATFTIPAWGFVVLNHKDEMP